MKRFFLFAAALLGLTSVATAKPVSANITLNDTAETQFACYIVSADAANVSISMVESGGGVTVYPRSKIKFITTRPPEDWTEAENSYNAGDFETAEAQFKKLSEEYAPIAALKDEYGSLAKYYYLQCLKKNGKFALLSDEIDTMRTQTIVLSETYADNAKWLVPWGFIGKENWDGLLAFVSSYIAEPAKAGEENPTPPFKKGISKSKAAELAYFRAVATENKGDAKTAMADYYRALTVAFGEDRLISSRAILALLKITKAADAEKENYFNKAELHSLAKLYQQTFGEGKLPEEFIRYLDAPTPPQSMVAPTEEKKPADGEAETPAETAPEDAKPEDAKPEDAKPEE